jgi:hypothetical protein
MTDTAVLYHKGCPDGWCSAWVAYNALAEQGDPPTLIGVTHGQPEPDLGDYSRVFIVDFAYSHEIMSAMAEERQVVVLDHHRTAIEDIMGSIGGLDAEGLEGGRILLELDAPYEAVLDTDRSGAGITWDYFHPDSGRSTLPARHDQPGRAPIMVNYVEDRDLWRWGLWRSRDVNAYLKSLPHELATWDAVAEQTSLQEMADLGAGGLNQIQAYARAAATQAYWCVMAGERFPIVNITYESCSDVVDHLLEVFQTDMAGYFFQRPDGLWQYGWRSTDDRSCRQIAEKFGGGGHDRASGCQVPELAHERVDAP